MQRWTSAEQIQRETLMCMPTWLSTLFLPLSGELRRSVWWKTMSFPITPLNSSPYAMVPRYTFKLFTICNGTKVFDQKACFSHTIIHKYRTHEPIKIYTPWDFTAKRLYYTTPQHAHLSIADLTDCRWSCHGPAKEGHGSNYLPHLDLLMLIWHALTPLAVRESWECLLVVRKHPRSPLALPAVAGLSH